MNRTPSPALVAGAGFSLVDSIYDHAAGANLTDDHTYERAMVAVIRDLYAAPAVPPHPALIVWLIEGRHSLALLELDRAGLIPADLREDVQKLIADFPLKFREQTDIEGKSPNFEGVPL